MDTRALSCLVWIKTVRICSRGGKNKLILRCIAILSRTIPSRCRQVNNRNFNNKKILIIHFNLFTCCNILFAWCRALQKTCFCLQVLWQRTDFTSNINYYVIHLLIVFNDHHKSRKWLANSDVYKYFRKSRMEIKKIYRDTSRCIDKRFRIESLTSESESNQIVARDKRFPPLTCSSRYASVSILV